MATMNVAPTGIAEVDRAVVQEEFETSAMAHNASTPTTSAMQNSTTAKPCQLQHAKPEQELQAVAYPPQHMLHPSCFQSIALHPSELRSP